jgi:hypothetical protein
MSADLDQAAYTLLTPARRIIEGHSRNERHLCCICHEPWPCFEANTAIQALDLVLRVHIAARGESSQAANVSTAVEY